MGCGQESVVEWLLTRSVDVQAGDALAEPHTAPQHALQAGHAWTPLHTAVWNGHTDVIERLLAAGARVDAVVGRGLAKARVPQGRPPAGIEGGTPLHLAAQRGHLLVVEALLAAGSKVNARDAHDAM